MKTSNSLTDSLKSVFAAVVIPIEILIAIAHLPFSFSAILQTFRAMILLITHFPATTWRSYSKEDLSFQY